MKPKDYPYKVLEEKVRDLDVKIVGVEHDEKFLSKHKGFLEEKIRQSDALVLECEPYFQDGFFDQLGTIAYLQGKKVYCADPMTRATQQMDKTQGRIGLGLALLAGLLGQTYAIPVGLYLFLGSFSGTVVRNIREGILAVKKQTVLDHKNYHDILFYGQTDYRNVIIAEGITKIGSEIKDVKNLACIHGALHTKPIKAYLKNPAFRKYKKLLYKLTYDLVSENKVREYTPDDMGWLLSRKF